MRLLGFVKVNEVLIGEGARGSGAAKDARWSTRIVMAGLDPAIHVLILSMDL